MFDFPNNPTIGQRVIVAANGACFTWDGKKWFPTTAANMPFVQYSGGTMTGPLALAGGSTVPTQGASDNSLNIASTAFVQNAVGNYLPLWGGTLSGGLHFGSATAPSTYDLSRHIDLWGGVFGFNVMPSTLGYMTGSGGNHVFSVGGVWCATINASGVWTSSATRTYSGRLISQGPGNQPCLTVYDGNNAVASGMWIDPDGHVGFGNCDGNGNPTSRLVALDRSGNMTAAAFWGNSYIQSGGDIRALNALWSDGAGRIVAKSTGGNSASIFCWVPGAGSNGVWNDGNNVLWFGESYDGVNPSAGRAALDTSGYFSANSLGATTSITSFNGRLFSRGGSNPSVTVWNTYSGTASCMFEDAGGVLAFGDAVGDGTPQNYRMYIDRGSNLNVGGQIYCNNVINCNVNSYGVRYQSGSYSTGHAFLFGWANMYAGTVTVSVDNGGAAYGLQGVSDARLKSSITPSTFDCLDMLRRLPLHEFDWLDVPDPWQLGQARIRETGAHRRIGLIAQEVAKIFPEGVMEGDDFDDHLGRLWQIDHNDMIALLIGAVQQLADQVERMVGRRV